MPPEGEKKKEQEACLRKCFLSECLTFCQGCGRTMEQIKSWRTLTPEERKKALKEAEERKSFCCRRLTG